MKDKNSHSPVSLLQTPQTRRTFLRRSATTFGGALAGAGIYELVDTFARPPLRPAYAATALPPEQHLLLNTQVILDDGTGSSSSNGNIAVVVPPLHHEVITARVNVAPGAAPLQQAQRQLESILQQLESSFPPTPAGLGITLAWGLSYFQNFIPSLQVSSPFFAAGTKYPNYLPIDLRASKAAGKTVRAVIDAITFPSDQAPFNYPGVILEQHDVAILLRSDSLAHIQAAEQALFGSSFNQPGGLFQVMSVRRGFAGGGFFGGQGLPSQMALAAGIPAADQIPPNAELFLGFTSTQQAALGPSVIANLESLPGLTDQWPNGYFMHGTTMHVSHLFEDLEGWYLGDSNANFSRFSDRVAAMFRPGLNVSPGTLTLPEGPVNVEAEALIQQDVQNFGVVGHSASLQPSSRLAQSVTDNYGNVYPAGTAVPQRADFNTLDNPFFFSEDYPTVNTPAAGLHFVVFAPTSDAFHRTRLAMDGHFADGTVLKLDPRSRGMGFNSVLFTTHRQNFLVPSRAHRSFPLAEFLS